MTSGTTKALYYIWSSSSSDVFAVGGGGTVKQHGGIILHYDGKSWSAITSGIIHNFYFSLKQRQMLL
jgi:hypothetical protein